MTTIHATTATQKTVDGPDPKDMRRGRSILNNIIPSSTGAATATTQAIPALKGKFDGISMRVPVITGSVSDITMLLKKKVTVEEVNKFLTQISKNPLYKGVLAVSNEELVSSDIVGRTESAIVDLTMTTVADGDLVKICAWYDNEWGYSHRLVEMVGLAVK
jgi:glyceraldehyde 3-phosphate dehydrogenase